MANEPITQDEITRLKTNPRQLSWKDIVPGKGFAVPVTPIELKSGYLVSYRFVGVQGRSKTPYFSTGIHRPRLKAQYSPKKAFARMDFRVSINIYCISTY